MRSDNDPSPLRQAKQKRLSDESISHDNDHTPSRDKRSTMDDAYTPNNLPSRATNAHSIKT